MTKPKLRSEQLPKNRRSFTGCYTCRLRKIKCDGVRPACQRCQRSKVSCMGYDIQLRWSLSLSIAKNGELTELPETQDPMTNDMGSLKRRNVDFVKFKKLYQFEYEVDRDLNYCNSENLERADNGFILKGPFGICKLEYFGVKSKQKPVQKGREMVPVHSGNYSTNMYPISTNDSDLRSTFTLNGNAHGNPGHQVEEDEEDEEEDRIEVWIDKSLQNEARVSFWFCKNEVIDEYSDVIHVIFAKYFELENETSANSLMEMYRHADLGDLMDSSEVKMGSNFGEMMSFFIDHINLMMPITFKGNIYETLIIPLIYQHVGQIAISDDATRESFGMYLKRLAVKQVMCLGSYLKYEATKDLEYLKASVSLRKEVLMELTWLLTKLTDREERFFINVEMSWLIQSYEIKNLVLVLILMIKIDYFVQILENFNKWFKLMDNLIEFLNNYNDSILNNLTFSNVHEKLTLDKFNNLKKLIKLYRFMKIFYFSTAKIDMDNYQLGEEVEEFEDIIQEDYNLTKGDFIFDDGFNKIDNFLDIMIKKPQMINLEDKPTFTINFNHRGGSVSDSESESGEEEDVGEEEEEEMNDEEGVAMIDIPQPDNDTVFVGDIDDDLNKFSSIEFMYGLPLPLLELFNRIITLTNHKNFFTRRKLFPRNYPKLCCDLEEDLTNWKLTWRLFDEQHRFKSVFHEIMFHNIMSFYNSLCLYFERIIKETDPTLLQHYVTTSLKHLTRLVEIEDSNTKIAPLFWSFFISSSDAIEASLQELFVQLSPHFVGSNWVSKQIILEVWRKRQEGSHEVCWLDIVKQWDCDVLLVS